MKLRLLAIATLLLGSVVMFSCIDEQASNDIILEKDVAKIEKYLAENNLANVKELHDEDSGLRIIWQELSEDTLQAKITDTLKVDYTGKFLDNKVFDTSIESVAKANNIYTEARKYTPLEFPLGYGYLIFGFEWATLQMKQGDKATVLIPSEYAYGRQGNDVVPSNTPIIFELDLLKVTAGPRGN